MPFSAKSRVYEGALLIGMLSAWRTTPSRDKNFAFIDKETISTQIEMLSSLPEHLIHV
jgi:hypothetical protein